MYVCLDTLSAAGFTQKQRYLDCWCSVSCMCDRVLWPLQMMLSIIRFDYENMRAEYVKVDRTDLSKRYECVTIDEQLFTFSGYSKFIQYLHTYIPLKLAKYGIKIFLRLWLIKSLFVIRPGLHCESNGIIVHDKHTNGIESIRLVEILCKMR